MNLEQALEALRTPAPDSVRDGALLGAGLLHGYALYESPVGQVAVTFSVTGVSDVDLAGDDVEARLEQRLGIELVPAEPPRAWASAIPKAIERGTPGDLPLDLGTVTPFQRTVLDVTAAIPFGEVRPYGWVAEQIGSPGASRAVGSAVARNPVPLIIPCHRVVRSDGKIGNYSLGGPDRKWQLLTHEGADPHGLEELAARGVRYTGSDTTRIFCHPSCRHARRTSPSHVVEFRNEEEAQEAGYRPCKVCRP